MKGLNRERVGECGPALPRDDDEVLVGVVRPARFVHLPFLWAL